MKSDPRSEKRFEFLIEHISDGICAYEFAVPLDLSLPTEKKVRESFDAICVECNTAYAALHGSRRDTMLGLKLPALGANRENAHAYLAAFYENDCRIEAMESHEANPSQNGKWFLNSLFGESEDGRLLRIWHRQYDITERKQAEEALRESESSLKRSQAVAHVGHWTWDTRANKVTWSDEMYHIFGLNREAFTGNLDEVINAAIHPDDKARVLKSNEAVLTEQRPGTLEYRVVWPDGAVRHVWAQPGASVFDDKGNIVSLSGIVQDITERKEAEEALVAERQLLRTLIDNVPDRIYIKDTQGRFILKNEADTHQIGAASPDEVIGKTDFDYYPPEIAEQYRADDQTVIQSGQPLINREERVVDARGTQGWILTSKVPLRDNQGKVIGLVGIGRDITERKQAEEALKAVHDKLKATLAAIPDLMFEVDQAGRIYDYYAPAREMLYVPPEVFLGKTFNEVLPESTADTILQALAQAAQQGWHRGATYALDLPTGRHWFELSIATKGEPNPTQTHFLVLARDVTERKQAEEALRERDRLRIALEKEKELNTIKNNIMQTISHEFRTPLAVMSSSSFLLTHYYDRLNSDQRKEQLESIRSQVEKLDQMVEGIVSTAQGMVDELVFQPSHTNLELLGHLTVTELQSTAGAKHQIVFVNEGQLQSVLIDKRLVNRILTDLLSNAIKYSPEGSVIRLHISVEEDAIVIQVSDQGIGISAEDQKWLFEPFFRASNVGMARGIGLGLTVVRDCVALHQGTIVVESELQKGTTFTVRLPKQPKHPGGN